MPNQVLMCPVCAGRQTVPAGFYNAAPDGTSSGTGAAREKCRTCGGTGMVWTDDGQGKPQETPKDGSTVLNIRDSESHIA